MRKAITILLALVMVLSLAACGGGSETANTAVSAEAATNQPAPTETTENTEAPTVTSTSEPAPDAIPAENQEEQEEQHINEFAVEDFNIVDYPTNPNRAFDFRAKIRNLSEEKAYYISFSVQFLDNSGDLLNTGELGIENLDPLQGGWSDVHGQGFEIPLTVDEVGSVRFFDYIVFDENYNFQYSGTLSPEIIFNIDDITVKTN